MSIVYDVMFHDTNWLVILSFITWVMVGDRMPR